MTKRVLINLPVKRLDKSIYFFKNAQSTPEVLIALEAASKGEVAEKIGITRTYGA